MLVGLRDEDSTAKKTTGYFLTATWEENNQKMIQDFVVYTYSRESAIVIVDRDIELRGEIIDDRVVTVDVILEGSLGEDDVEAIYYVSPPMPANDEQNKVKEILDIIAKFKKDELYADCDIYPPGSPGFDIELEPDYEADADYIDYDEYHKSPEYLEFMRAQHEAEQEQEKMMLFRGWISSYPMIFMEEFRNITAIIEDENGEQKDINAYTHYKNCCKKHDELSDDERLDIIIDILKSCHPVNGNSAIDYLFYKYYWDITGLDEDDQVFD